jgi:hypothetical protein
MVLPEDT